MALSEHRKKVIRALIRDNGEIRTIDEFIHNIDMLMAYCETQKLYFEVTKNGYQTEKLELMISYTCEIKDFFIKLKNEYKDDLQSLQVGEITLDDLFLI